DHLGGGYTDGAGEKIPSHAFNGIIDIDYLIILTKTQVGVAPGNHTGIVIGELVGEIADFVPVHDSIPEQAVFFHRNRAYARVDALLNFSFFLGVVIDNFLSAGQKVDGRNTVGPLKKVRWRWRHLAQGFGFHAQLGGFFGVIHNFAELVVV